jgi:hypothetical protein
MLIAESIWFLKEVKRPKRGNKERWREKRVRSKENGVE